MEYRAIKTLSGIQLKRKKRMHNIARRIIQAIFFLAMPSIFSAGFAGIKTIFSRMSVGAPLTLDMLAWTLILVASFTIVFGRFFCGYACAFGSFGDFIHWMAWIIQVKLFGFKKQYEMHESLSRKLRPLKYMNLAFIVIFSAFGLYSKLNGTSTWDVFAQLSSFSSSFSLGGYAVGILLLIVVIFLMAINERAFCQFLCPLGAFFALLPSVGILRRNKKKCIKGCTICKKTCPVDLQLESNGFANGECLGCEKCTTTCPRASVAHPMTNLLRNELASVIVKAALLFILGSIVGLCRFF